MGSRFQLHVHWWGICYDKLSHIEISWFKGVILSLPLSPLVILQDSPWQFISAHSPLRNVPLGGRLHWKKEEFFQSTQQNHSASACMCAYGSSGQNASHYTLSYFSPITAKEADQILVVIAAFWMSWQCLSQ